MDTKKRRYCESSGVFLFVEGQLFAEYKIDCKNQTQETHGVIPAQSLGTEDKQREDRENRERYDLLNHLQLDQREWTSIFTETDAVCGHLKEVFEQSNTPANQHDSDQAELIETLHLAEFEVAVPRHSHKHVGHHEQSDCHQSLHFDLVLKVCQKSAAKLYILIQNANRATLELCSAVVILLFKILDR